MDNGVLRLGIQVDSTSTRSTALLLGNKAVNLSKVAKLAETDLQNFFQVNSLIKTRNKNWKKKLNFRFV
jgi:hypothetical protein